MSAQLDRIEEKLDRLLQHLGVGATSPAPAEVDTKLIEKYAEERKRALAGLKTLFHEDTDELTDLGRQVLGDAWMGDGVTPKS